MLFARQCLAVGAEVATAVPDGKTLYASTTDGRGVTAAVGDIEVELGGAWLPVRAFIGINAGTSAFDG